MPLDGTKFYKDVGGALRAAIFHRREQLRGRRWDSASHIQGRGLTRACGPAEERFVIGHWSMVICYWVIY